MERLDSKTTEKVCIDMPVNLARVLRADAVLQKLSFEEHLLDTLHNIVISRLQSDWTSDVFAQSYKGKDIDGNDIDNVDKQEVAAQ